jgi:hypothetical protein
MVCLFVKIRSNKIDLKIVNISRQLLLILEVRYRPKCLEIWITASL